MSKRKNTTVTETTEATTPTKPLSAEVPADLIAQLRAAESPDDAVRLLSPDAGKPKSKPDTVFELVDPMPKPLPQKRGLSVLVYVTAVRLNAAFKIAEIEAALPDKKSVKYWVRALAKSGHFREQTAN